MITFHELPACERYYRPPALVNAVGFIPSFLSKDDTRPARDQFNVAYVGGWSPITGFKLTANGSELPSVKYPGDPALPPLAYGQLRDEIIIVYPSAWVMILQPDGSYEISRMD